MSFSEKIRDKQDKEGLQLIYKGIMFVHTKSAPKNMGLIGHLINT